MTAPLTFKHPRLESEFVRSHPEGKALIRDFAEQSLVVGWPTPIITDVWRSEAENKAVNGLPNSRHLCASAWDLSSRIYSDAQRWHVLAWLEAELRKRGKRTGWGMLVHNAGTGSHLHIERKDPIWAATYPRQGHA